MTYTGKDILYRVGNGGRCGCEAVSRKVLPQVEIPEKWTQEPPCFAITTGVWFRSHTKNLLRKMTCAIFSCTFTRAMFCPLSSVNQYHPSIVFWQMADIDWCWHYRRSEKSNPKRWNITWLSKENIRVFSTGPHQNPASAQMPKQTRHNV